MFVASPHVGITAPRSSLIASGISWAFIHCRAIRPVRILAGVLFFYSPLPLSFQLAYCIICICASFRSSLFIPTSHYIFIFISWGRKLKMCTLASHSCTLLSIYPSRYIWINTPSHIVNSTSFSTLSSLPSIDSKYPLISLRTKCWGNIYHARSTQLVNQAIHSFSLPQSPISPYNRLYQLVANRLILWLNETGYLGGESIHSVPHM